MQTILMLAEINWGEVANIVIALVSLVVGSPLFLLLMRRAGLARDEREAQELQQAAKQAVALIEARSHLDGAKGKAKMEAVLESLADKFPKRELHELRAVAELALAELGHGIGKPQPLMLPLASTMTATNVAGTVVQEYDLNKPTEPIGDDEMGRAD